MAERVHDLLTERGALIMLGAVVFAFVIALTRRRISRIEGTALLVIYVVAIIAISGGGDGDGEEAARVLTLFS